MRILKQAIYILTLIILVSACNSQPQQEENIQEIAKPEQSETTRIKSEKISLRNDQLNAIFKQYQQLTNALTAGDVSAAKISALAIETGAARINGGKELEITAGKITDAKLLQVQRDNYALLSNEFIRLLRKSGLDQGELYIAHCPMARNDKGADWISHTKEIRNPYFGADMLTCGSVTETIAGTQPEVTREFQ